MDTEHTEKTIGFVGLGRMGQAMCARLVEAGYRVHATDVDSAARDAAAQHGVCVYEDVAGLIAQLPSPATVWLMVPSQYVETVLTEIVAHLPEGGTIIDGGNSPYQDSQRRYHELKDRGIDWLDCGTSGGIEGARHGASLMVGGEIEVFAAHEHLFNTLAVPDGYARVGGPGAGHFVKAVHNGIEYGMMGALAEGLALLDEYQSQFDLSVEQVLRPYEHGSIITSRLMSWLAEGYREGLPEQIAGEVPMGETETKMEHLTTLGTMPILQAAIQQRRTTRETPSRAGAYLSTMRNKFGGHAMIPSVDENNQESDRP